ncbi:MAG TPA: NAD(P)H-hydrate dehydratase [Stellaceae bacterium]|nr:NAD(P)H-hydrate dehydratase [Stellaceae bacterium]
MRADELALLTPAEMGEADKAAIASGVAGSVLMEAAGRAVAEAVLRRWPGAPVAVLCGPGNNGGDGFVAARHLATAGAPVRLGLLGAREKLGGDAAHAAAQWTGAVEPLTPALLEGAAVAIDAVFGAGLARPVDGAAAASLAALAASGVPSVAVDVPSGLDGATGEVRGVAAKAAVTVTFFRKKPGHLLLPGRALCGTLVVADIGIPDSVLERIAPRAHENGPALWLGAFPWPGPDSHKYRRGEAVVRGGAEMTGAGRLAGRAAARIGAGLVSLAVPETAWPVYAGSLQGIIVRPVADAAGLAALLADPRRTATLVGPGAGVGPATRDEALAALATGRAVTLDADALTSFSDRPGALFSAGAGPTVLTPHEGEFRRLFGDLPGDKLSRARAAAARSRAVMLLKGADTVVAAPDGRAVINANAPPWLATGGSGDVLAGMITGLMAQGLGAFDAASCAAWLHGEAGRQAGPGLVAEDLIEALPRVLRRLAAAATLI